MRRRELVGAVASLGVAELAGCASSSGGATTTASGTATSAGGGSGGVTVTMQNTAFHPIRATADVGATVTWVNEDSTGHTVEAEQLTSDGTAWSFESDTLKNGDTTTHAFDSKGVYEYYCSIHGEETMCGVVLVGGATLDQSLPCEEGGSTTTSGSGGSY